MPKILRLCGVLAVSLVLFGQSHPTALRELSNLRPDIKWDSKAVVADIACDHGPDHAYLGRMADHVYVGFVRASNTKAEVLQFGVGGDRQDAICGEPAKLSAESLDYDLDVKGYKRSRTCKGLVLSGGDCDPIHLFWNHATQRLDWWRN